MPLPEPSADALQASRALQSQIQQTILANNGWISFSRYMELALYTPGLGYYAGGAVKLGKEGDFTTAPEISPLFGATLARFAHQLLGDQPLHLLEFGAGTGKLAADLLERMPAVRRQLLVLSDFQPADWNSLSAGPAAALQQRLQNGSVPTQILLLAGTAPRPEVRPDNITVESLQLPQQPVGVGQDFSVQARLKSYSSRDLETVAVSLTLDGQPVSTVQTTLKSGGTAEVLFRCRSEVAGSHVLTVSAAVDDLLAADNQRSAAIDLLDLVKVLDRKSTRLNSSHEWISRMPSSA